MDVTVEETVGVDEHRANYVRDGAVCTRGVVDPAAAMRLLEEAQQAGSSGDDFRLDMNMVERLPTYWDCVGSLPAIAGALMASERIRFYNDHMFVKKAGASIPSAWHQDGPYFPFQGDQIIAAWIALTPVRREAGALQYVRGSHRIGAFYRPSPIPMADATHPDYLALPECPDLFDPGLRAHVDFLTWDMEPGDVLWHHPLSVHGAYANNSPANPIRAGLTVRFLGDDVTWDPRPYLRVEPKTPTVARGQHLVDDGAFPLLWTKTSGDLRT